MKRITSNQKGITLVEVLAILAIGSIFILLATNIFGLIQQQYDTQSQHASELVDVAYAAKVITKEIRQNPDDLEVNPEDENYDLRISDKKYRYNHENKSIEINKNDTNYQVFISNVEKFTVKMIEGNTLALLIESDMGKKIETDIVIRQGGGSEGD